MRGNRVPRRSLNRTIVYALLLGTVFLTAASAYGGFAPIVVSPATLPNGTAGVAYNQTVSATGGASTSYTWSVSSGNLPTGLQLGPPTFGPSVQISGTPTAAGSFTFTITAVDSGSNSGSRTYTVIISCPVIGILPSVLPGGAQGSPYNQTLTGVGGQGPYTFLIASGALPPGLVLSNFGVISGTPTSSGSFPFTVQATDANGCRGSASYTINVSSSCPPPAAPFLTANPTSVSSPQAVTLSWNATIAAGQGSYNVLLSVNGGVVSTVGTVSASASSTVSFSYFVSSPGTYDFQVQAMVNCGSSTLSNIARVVVMAPCPQSPRVSGVVLTPTTAAPGATFTVSWSALGGFSGTYGVYKSTDGGQNFTLLATTANTSYVGTVTDPAGTTITFEVEANVSCVYPTRSNFVTLTVVSGTCTPPGPVTNIQIQSAGVAPPRAPAPTEFIFVSWTGPVAGTPVNRFGLRINGDPEVSVQGTSVTLLPRGSRLDPIQAFVKAYACVPEQAGPEVGSPVVALFLTPPQAQFSISSNPRVNVPVVFTDTSSPQATSWLWVFDDGTTDQHQSPSHAFAVPGPHVVFLIASNGAGSSETSQVVTVGAAAAVIQAARVVGIDATDRQRRRAQVHIAAGRTWLRIEPLGGEEVVLFLRFVTENGEAVMERRLVVEPGAQGVYDLSAYGLSGEYGIELVGGGDYEATLTVVGRPQVRETER